jgi:protease secretion system membrane fusion protein
MALQTQLFTSRRAALQAELGMLRENSQGTQEQLKGLESLKQSREQQLSFVNEELKGVRDMAAQGYVPRNRMLQLERTVSEISGQLAENIANIGRTKNALSELKLRMLQRQKEYQKEVETQLTELQKETRAQADRLAALEYEMANTQIKSPIDGVVVGINIHTVGGVIQPGFHIMDVVPQHEPMVIEAKIPTSLIDKMHPGLPVDLTFAAFNHAQTPNVPGEVETVGADVLIDELSRMPYYPIKVKVSAAGMKTLSKHQIRPGMPVTVTVKTGERTMLNYLIKPMTARIGSAFKEE